MPAAPREIETLFGTLVGPPGSGKTSLWGDLDLNGQADINDVLISVNVWLGLFQVLPEVANIDPCIPNALPVNINDVLQEVLIWLSAPFACDLPCP